MDLPILLFYIKTRRKSDFKREKKAGGNAGFKNFLLKFTIYQISIFAPISLTNSATIAASPGQAGAVTRFPSTTALSASTSI